MIKVITIDFWNTLFDSSGGSVRNDYRRNHLLKEISQYEIEVTPELFDKALRASWEHFNGIWRNEMRTPEVAESVGFFWNFLKLPNDDVAVARLVQCFAESILVYPPAMLPGAKAQLEELSKAYSLGLVSDTGFSPGTVLRKLLEANDVLQYFSAFSFSNETGVAKPNPKAFSTILDNLRFSPENSVHIGDIEATDIVGAKQFGMKAIKFTGDPTAIFSKENPIKSLADIEVKHWDDMELAVDKITLL